MFHLGDNVQAFEGKYGLFLLSAGGGLEPCVEVGYGEGRGSVEHCHDYRFGCDFVSSTTSLHCTHSPRCGSMQRYTANTVEGCSYSLLCVAIGRPSKYSSACADDEADIVEGCGGEYVGLPPYYHIRRREYREIEQKRRVRRAFGLRKVKLQASNQRKYLDDAPSKRKADPTNSAPPLFSFRGT